MYLDNYVAISPSAKQLQGRNKKLVDKGHFLPHMPLNRGSVYVPYLTIAITYVVRRAIVFQDARVLVSRIR